MKILFAVDNDNISEAIMKKYQRDYKEILSYKNVYYFNAILKELQNNKNYDRIVISEDLEPFANNNYDTIDKFLFEKLERIKEEAVKANGTEIDIVLICADRRSLADEMLNKLFGIKIYNALIGDDRNSDKLCKLIKQPRNKKEAKIAYKIEGNAGVDDENGVSELEVQNILTHYKRLGRNEDKYVDSFNNIVSQYTDEQLRIIIRYLPLHVKAVLEQKSPKYQQLSTFSVRNNVQETYTPRNLQTIRAKEEKIDVTMLKNEKERITKPIVIPSELNNKKTVKIKQKETSPKEIEIEELQDEVVEAPKKGRGRPRKKPVQEVQEDKPKRGRGRPKKEVAIEEKKDIDDIDVDLFGLADINTTENMEFTKRKVEDKSVNIVEEMDFDLFNMDEEESDKEDLLDDLDLFNIDEASVEDAKEEIEEINLFSMDNDEDEALNDNEGIDEYETVNKYEMTNDFEDEEILNNNTVRDIDEESDISGENYYVEPTVRNTTTLSTLLTNEKKIVSFVGTTKNGTSFVVNNLGLTLAEMNISTAILDMTQNKNSYYIFTNNEDKLRRIAENCISNLENGIAQGIKVAKNLTVYTDVPGTEKKYENLENILVNLIENHDVVLIDTDFNTDIHVFEKSQEIYLVQSMDVLTIQPFTAFLRNLKTKNILKQEKIKIVINKAQKLRTLTDSLLIGGMSSYNDPSMTLMTELFDKDNVKYCKIPFEVQNYAKYLDSLASCEVYLRGYTKPLLLALHELAETVYPLINKTKYSSKGKNRMEFSDSTRNTLNKMKKNY